MPLTHVVLKETLRLSLTFWCHNDKCFCISEKDVIAWVDKEFPQGLSSMFDKVMHYYYLKRLLVKKSDLVSKKKGTLLKSDILCLPIYAYRFLTNTLSFKVWSLATSWRIHFTKIKSVIQMSMINLVSLMLIPSDRNVHKK